MTTYNREPGYAMEIKFTLEDHLKNYAEVDTNAKSLLETYHIIRGKMESNLRTIIIFFSSYSEHDQGHSERIISAIERLLGRKRIEKLTPADTWMILVCAYMHDLGMIIQGKELEKDWQTDEFKAHIRKCMESDDDELSEAAKRVSSINWTTSNLSWPVHIYRSVILLASEFYRTKHPERSMELPQRNKLKGALDALICGSKKIPRRIQKAIGKICYSHGISFEEMLNYLEPVDSILDYVFHPRFVAALLCLGDLCDLDNGRFNDVAMESIGELTKNNLIHYFKHESVTLYLIDESAIFVNFDIQRRKIKNEIKNFLETKMFDDEDFRDFCDKVFLATQNWINWMINIIENLKIHWNELFMNIESLSINLKYKILIDGAESVYSGKNLKFSFSNEKALELIEGYSLYNDEFIFIRELLQNSFDAVKKQFWNDILLGKWDYLLKHMQIDGKINYRDIQPFDFSNTEVFDYYKIKITIKHRDEDNYAFFSIEDNGIGISQEDLENRIVKTGNQDYAIDCMPEWLRPTSAFGIGLHSVFAVTDTIFIETRTEFDPKCYYINLHSGSKDGYIFMNVADDNNIRFCNSIRGTKIHFKVNISKYTVSFYDMDFFEEIDPFRFYGKSEFCYKIERKIYDFIRNTLFNFKIQINENEIKFNPIYEDEHFGRLFISEIRDHIFNQKILDMNYNFALDNTGNYLVVWDKTRAILMYYSLERTIDKNMTICKVYCKGFLVKNTRIYEKNFLSMPTMIDLWGENTRKVLNLSRDKLTYEQFEDTISAIKKAESFRGKIYYSMLKIILKDKDIKEWHIRIERMASAFSGKKSKFDYVVNKFDREINMMVLKYSNKFISEINIKKLIFIHVFFAIIRKCRRYIESNLKHMSNIEEKIKYILRAELLEDGNLINKTIKEATFFYEYVSKYLNGIEFEDYATMLIYEFADVFFACESISVKYLEQPCFGDYFGRMYIPFSDNFSRLPYNRVEKDGERSENRDLIEFESAPIYLFLSTPITLIINYLLFFDVDFSELKSEINAELKYIPGYNFGYGFINCSNVGDIILKSSLIIKQIDLNMRISNLFPFIDRLHCNSIGLNDRGDLIISFNKEKDDYSNIEYTLESIKKYLLSHSNSLIIPALVGFENISIKIDRYFNLKDFLTLHYSDLPWEKNHVILLWDDFKNINTSYAGKITSEEDANKLAVCIMKQALEERNSIFNLLNYIHRHKAFSIDSSAENSWRDIFNAYTEFVALILKCLLNISAT